MLFAAAEAWKRCWDASQMSRMRHAATGRQTGCSLINRDSWIRSSGRSLVRFQVS